MMIATRLKTILFTSSLLISSAVLADHVPEIDCLIEPNMMIELSSSVSGVLDTITVDRSDTVKKGQIVATLKSDVEQVKVKASQETLNVSRVEQKRSRELYRDNAITLSEKEQSDHEAVLNKLEVEHAQANLELRNIRSPIDGVVVDRYLMPGEFTEEKPVLKLAQLDPLRVEVVAPVTYFGLIKTGVHAQIKTEFGSFENLIAEVVVVDKVVDAASGTFGIRLELQNKDYKIPGGLKCTVRFFDDDEEADYARLHSSGNAKSALTAPSITEQSIPGDKQNSICRRIGPFKKKDSLIALMNALENEINGYEIRDETTVATLYRVTTDTLASHEAAKLLKAEMEQAGVKDIAILKRASGYSISLGMFSSEHSANRRQVDINKLGYDNQIIPQEFNKSIYWAEVTADKSEDDLSALVTAAGVEGANILLYQSCNTEILASGNIQ
jgi:membrane fusion protein (multidrug efflux system)